MTELNGRFQWSSWKHKRCFSLYKQGLNDVEIAGLLGCRHGTIAYWRQRRGLSPNRFVKVDRRSHFNEQYCDWNQFCEDKLAVRTDTFILPVCGSPVDSCNHRVYDPPHVQRREGR